MPRFKVELEKAAPREGQIRHNPFVGGIVGGTITMNIRAWEMDAEDEAEIRAFYADAVKNDLPNVRGYSIRSIEQVAP